jgi:hypothetical protein
LAALEKLTVKGNADGVIILGLFGHGVEMEFNVKDEKGQVLTSEEGCFCPYDTKVIHVKDENGKLLYSRDESPLIEPVTGSLVRMREIMERLKVLGH